MSIKLSSTLLRLTGCLAISACNSAESAVAPPANPPSPVAEVAPAAAPAPTATLGPMVEDPTFQLSATAAGPYTLNQLGHFAITLTPKGEYHVNEEYPLAISITAPGGVSVPKTELAKSDAATVTAKTARFDVPVTITQAGEHRVTAKVSFAVCTPENCMPDERTLELALLVP